MALLLAPVSIMADTINDDLYVTGDVAIGAGSLLRNLRVYNNAASPAGSQWQNSVTGSTIGDGFFFGVNSTGEVRMQNYENTDFRFYTNALERMVIKNDGKVGIGTTSPTTLLEVAGEATVDVLNVTGSDMAELFDVRAEEAGAKPGMVVSIDPENPGALVVSSTTYDRTVAGIISGAGAFKPGMLLGRTGAVEDGDYPVTLSGRTYCYVDATKAPVAPGDLLTTSDVPGHAMKVTDYAQAHGAIIGKAMSSLESGRGLVMVLVCLQ